MDVRFVLVMARSRRTMAGTIFCGAATVALRGKGMAVLRVAGGRPVAAIGEDLDFMTVDNEPLQWQAINPGPRVERKRWALPQEPLDTSLNRD